MKQAILKIFVIPLLSVCASGCGGGSGVNDAGYRDAAMIGEGPTDLTQFLDADLGGGLKVDAATGKDSGTANPADALQTQDAILTLDVQIPEDAAHDGMGSVDVNAPENPILWSVRMADSVLKRSPNALTFDSSRNPSWNYTQGFMFTALEALFRQTQTIKYGDYVTTYYEGIIDAQGRIGGGYNVEEYSLDRITPGKALLGVYAKTGKEKFKTALQTLRTQLRNQPRNTVGGYWHKKRYPNQMWLDSLYMGPAFLAQYGTTQGEDAAVDEAILQFTLLEEHARDPGTGLLFHGWDESRLEKWSNPQTGTSASFWGRAMGWYAMALVDTLEILPQSHPKRSELLAILDRLVAAIRKVQDPASGVWYQVMDQGSKAGNYLESSASCMFSYTLLKATRLGYVDGANREAGLRAYEGILKEFIRVQSSGEVGITRVCLSAGLGTDPLSGRYRDGSFAYYISEPKVDNDTKAVAAFILASLEYEWKPAAGL